MRTHNSWIGCLCLMMTGCLSPIRTPQAPASSTPPEEASAIASWEEPIAAGPIPLGPVDGTPIRPSRPKTPSEPECSNPSYSVQRISHLTFDGNDLILDRLTNSDLVRGRTYSRGALRREFIWNAETETLRTLRDLTLPPSESFTFMSSERAVNDLGELAGTSCGLQSGAWTCYPTVERLGGWELHCF
jgi:hypothetical protein